MKHKSQLRIIEQTIMILVFAIVAAICLKAFFATSEISGEIRLKDLAVTEVQNTAETLKGSRGDCEKAAELLGGSFDGDVLKKECAGFTVTAVPVREDGLPAEARVFAEDPDGNVLFEIQAAWQEG